MTIHSSLRKRFRKLIANSKGFSSVIGTTFMVLVMLFLSTSVFLWTLSQNTIYNEAVRARNQEEADCQNENVVASAGNYSVTGDQVTVKVVLKNAGSIAVQIINLWVLDTSIQRYTNKSLSLSLTPGEVLNLVEPSPLTVTIPGADPNHNFASWFVTARGNTIPLEKEQAVIVAQLAQGIGSLALDFDTFRYYNISGGKLVNCPAGNPTFRVPYGETIAFGFNLTNFDQSKKTITFHGQSVLWSIFPASPGQLNGPIWYIANVNPDGSIDATYSPISLAWGESKLFVFAKQAGKWFTQQQNTLGALNLLLYGTFQDESEYAQNIPFVAIYAYT
ncbi:MAG: hypothetical protein QMD13_09780 [Candidatus Bathyarchaeia archaeon]|nr:hypothetical protein [Candidatus Bathyarchaeia archaeon]